jgi:antitoxin (DNA-binding transcriptional repressor) of toxin-antitoxin stability system
LGHLLSTVALTHASVTIERAGKPVARLVGIEGTEQGSRSRGKLELRASRGLGKDVWRSVKADAYLAGERDSWD